MNDITESNAKQMISAWEQIPGNDAGLVVLTEPGPHPLVRAVQNIIEKHLWALNDQKGERCVLPRGALQRGGGIKKHMLHKLSVRGVLDTQEIAAAIVTELSDELGVDQADLFKWIGVMCASPGYDGPDGWVDRS